MTSPAHQNQPLPVVPGYKLRWEGPSLVIQPDCWRKPVGELGQEIVAIVASLKPQFLILNLKGIENFWALMGGMVAKFARDVDAFKNRGRCLVVGAEPNVQAYFQITRFDRFLELLPSEVDAFQYVEQQLRHLDSNLGETSHERHVKYDDH